MKCIYQSADIIVNLAQTEVHGRSGCGFRRSVLDGREFKSPLLQSMKECRAAVEKQTAKKVKSISQVKDGDSYVGLIGRCPCCGDILEEDTVYCDCGQRLDWETSNEIDSKRNS